MENEMTTIRLGIASLTEQVKGALRRIDEQAKLTDSVHKLATAMEVLANRMGAFEKKQDSIQKELEAIKMKPAQRWESIVGQVVGLLVAACAGFLISKLT